MTSFIFKALQKAYQQFKETYAEVKKEREERERSNLQRNFVNENKAKNAPEELIARKNQSLKASKRNKPAGNVEGEETNWNMAHRNY